MSLQTHRSPGMLAVCLTAALVCAHFSAREIHARQKARPSTTPVTTQSRADEAAKPPITKEGLVKALGIGGLSTEEVVQIVEQRGVTFELTATDESELLKAGADLKLIEAVRNNCRAPLSQGWLMDALRAEGRDVAAIARQIERRGVTFRTNEEIEARLRTQGATPAIIEAARKKYRGPLERKELEAMLRLTQKQPQRLTASDVAAEIKYRGVGFKLTGRDTIALKKSGASDEVIAAALDNYRSDTVASNPQLSVPPTISADPLLFPPDQRNIPYGDPKSNAQPSSGPGIGTGQGSGSGQGGGMGTGTGSGEGAGIGPGRGGPKDGGEATFGGGGGEPDYSRPFRINEVTKKAVVTYMPKPGYTEEARKNQVQGTVRLRLIFHANGTITNISIVSGLPHGLSERAIAAARQIKFQPAQKDGRAVSQYAMIEYNFTLY